MLNIYLNVLKLDDGSGYFGGAIQQSKRHQIQRTIHVKAVLLVRFDGDLYLRCIITNRITSCIFSLELSGKPCNDHMDSMLFYLEASDINMEAKGLSLSL